MGRSKNWKLLDELHKRLQSDDLRERLDAATALWEIRGDVEKVLPVARDIARDDRGVTASGYTATTRVVDGARVEQQHPFEEPLAAQAAQLLGKMGAAAKPAVGDLVQLLAHPNARARTAAFQTLDEMGPAAAEALPALQEFARQAGRQYLPTRYLPARKVSIPQQPLNRNDSVSAPFPGKPFFPINNQKNHSNCRCGKCFTNPFITRSTLEWLQSLSLAKEAHGVDPTNSVRPFSENPTELSNLACSRLAPSDSESSPSIVPRLDRSGCSPTSMAKSSCRPPSSSINAHSSMWPSASFAKRRRNTN